MPIDLLIKQIKFPDIPPTTLGKNRAMRGFSDQLHAFLNLIDRDLLDIVGMELSKELTQDLQQNLLLGYFHLSSKIGWNR